jgi:O-antigen/teichoic acid export membrane protein
MTQPVEDHSERLTRGRTFARNAALNLCGELVVILVGMACVPYVVRKLGVASFGILSISWVLLGYMGVFDLGLSRATTKFVAEAVGRRENHMVPSLIGTSLSLQVAFGLLGGICLAGLSPLLAGKLLKIPAASVLDAKISFWILAAAVPIVLVTNSLRGLLEAVQRFDVINAIKMPANASMYLSPIILLPLGGRLPSIMLLMTFLRLVAMLVYLKFCLYLLPSSGPRLTFSRHLLGRLLKYGGWVTVSNAVGPFVVYVDRFMVGSLLSISALGYYAAPADLANRSLIIPASLAATLFPGFSTLDAQGASQRLEEISTRALKYVTLTVGPGLLLLAAFSHDILRLWLGVQFAEQGSVVLQILALGIFFNALSFFPYCLLQGIGRPDLTATFHLAELPFHLGLAWLLISHLGITGAAIAWTLRILIDATLLFGACAWLRLISLRGIRQHGVLRGLIGLFLMVLVMYMLVSCRISLASQISIACCLFFLYMWAQWFVTLDSNDRQFFLSLLNVMRGSVRSLRKGHTKTLVAGSRI